LSIVHGLFLSVVWQCIPVATSNPGNRGGVENTQVSQNKAKDMTVSWNCIPQFSYGPPMEPQRCALKDHLPIEYGHMVMFAVGLLCHPGSPIGVIL